jgi:2-polyprenyl-3-methyl-5-hydroxy-6-metoxy-1,4-benzoquinol methylase
VPSRGVPCPLCKSIAHDPIERFGSFCFLRCPECTLEFCNPLQYSRENYDLAYKDQAADFYVPTSSWLSQASANLPESKWMLFSAQQNALKWIESNHPFASILDIGCGSGWFLARARQMGFRVKGVEVGSVPVQLLKQKGFEVECGSLEAIPENWQPDVVTLFEVLEHLPDPTDFLTKIRHRFQNSIFILSVPSPKRWTKGGKHRDVADYPPNHLTRWNTISLQRALSHAGYSKIEVTYPKPSALETASVSITGLIRSWFGEMPDALPEAIGTSSLRSLKAEVITRKVKCLPGLFFSNAFHFAGWSGISMLGIARP